jgi:hypothetical protein
MTDKTLLKRCLAFLLILLPIVTFFGFLFRYMLNVPVNDDYPAVLVFLNLYVKAPSLGEKLKLIFAQHNEHRIVFSRIWTLLSYKFQGNVNFNFLSFAGDLTLVGPAVIFFRKFLDLKRSWFLFIPVTVLLFNLSSWENMTFAMCALSNFAVHFFILLTLVCLTAKTTENKTYVLLAVVFFGAAMFTQGGGLSLYPISIGILLYKREYKNLFLYGGLATLILLFYFYGYHRPPQSPDLWIVLRDFKIRSILFYFAFLGNSFDYFLIFTNEVQESIGITTILGFVFFLLFIYITRTKYYKRNLFVYSIMALMMITALMTSLSRSPMGLEVAGASRYRINGIIFLIALYFWFIETYKVETKRAMAVILVITGWYYGMINLNQYEYLVVRQEQMSLDDWCTHTGDSSIVNPNPDEVVRQRAALDESARLNIYHLPDWAYLDAYFPKSVPEPATDGSDNSNLEMSKSVLHIKKIGHDYLIDGMGFLQWKSAEHQKIYLGIKNETDSTPVFYSTGIVKRFDQNPYFHKFNLLNSGFRARINENVIKPGENKVFIKVITGDQIKTSETDSKFNK